MTALDASPPSLPARGDGELTNPLADWHALLRDPSVSLVDAMAACPAALRSLTRTDP